MRKNAEFLLNRVDPQSGWADDTLRDAFRHSRRDTPPTDGGDGIGDGVIAGIVISAVIGLLLLVVGILCIIFRRLPRCQWPPWERREVPRGPRPPSVRTF